MADNDEYMVDHDRVSNCCGAPVFDPSGGGEGGICTECKEHCGYAPLCEPTFYRPVICNTPKGGRYNQTIDIVERGLDGECGADQNGRVVKGQGHQRLLLPLQEGQKHYVYCLRCGAVSHL